MVTQGLQEPQSPPAKSHDSAWMVGNPEVMAKNGDRSKRAYRRSASQLLSGAWRAAHVTCCSATTPEAI